MKILYGDIRSAIYNILQNRTYAAFCILGVSVMFVFITIILQLLNNVIVADSKPFVNADKEIHLNTYRDMQGRKIDGVPPEDVPLLLNDIKVYEYCALYDVQYGNIFVNDNMFSGIVTFVNSDYWLINDFHFSQGRSFTEEEVLAKTPVAIVKKEFAQKVYNTDQVIGQKLEFQDITYKIVGVVANYSNLSRNNDCIWVPSTFNQFIPDASRYFELYILPKQNITLDEFKNKVVFSLKNYFKNKSVEIDINNEDIRTLRDENIQFLGMDTLRYGIPIMIFFLLIIPAINIIIISLANVRNRAVEIAIRRTMGATILSSFRLLLMENLILVLIGTILGILLAIPFTHIVDKIFFSNGIYNNVSIVTNMDIRVLILGIAPISLLFSFLSGGIPAYILAKRDMAKILKGGYEC